MDDPSPLEGLPSIRIGAYGLGVSADDIAEFVRRFPVVSSDDNYLSHGGGVSEAIWRLTKEELSSDERVRAVLEDGIRPNLAEIVSSRLADGQLVLHAVTIDFDSGERLSAKTAQLLYGRILDELVEEGLASVVLPLLGTGAVGVDPQDSLTGLIQAVAERSILPFGVDVLVVTDLVDIQELTASARGIIPESVVEAGRDDRYQLPERHSTGDPLIGPTLAMNQGFFDPSELEGIAIEPRRPDRSQPPKSHLESAVSISLEQLATDNKRSPAVRDAARAVDNAGPKEIESAALGLWSALSSDRGKTPSSGFTGSWFTRAQAARNQLAHGMTSRRSPNLVRDLLRGCRVLLLDGERTESPPTPQFQDVPTSEVWDSLGTAHVRSLHELLTSSLDDGEKEREHRRLTEMGYRGDIDGCILESCVSEDPVDLLLRHFSGHELAELLRERKTTFQASEPTIRLAERLLHDLGFPRRDELVDPRRVSEELDIFSSEIHALSEAELLGRVTSLGRSVEAVLRTYVRFLCSGLLRVAPDKWLQDSDGNKGGRLPQTLGRATMGQLVYTVKAVGTAIDKSQDSRTKDLVRELHDEGAKPIWIPGKAHDLVKGRNIWVHGDAQGSRSPLAEQRKQAAEFARLCRDLLAALTAGPFPAVILVEEIAYDRWGRRRVRARAADGKVEELFTNEILIPGEVYLMHTVTNPLRVDPLLVAVGNDSSSSE